MNLRTATIRLAYENPDLRPYLMPILEGMQKQGDTELPRPSDVPPSPTTASLERRASGTLSDFFEAVLDDALGALLRKYRGGGCRRCWPYVSNMVRE